MKNLFPILVIAFLLIFLGIWGCNKIGKVTPHSEGDVIFKQITRQITAKGGNISLPDVASVTFDEGTFANTVPVKLSQTAFKSAQDAFDFAKILFAVVDTVGYEIRINTGKFLPQRPVKVTLTLPLDFINKSGFEKGMEVFAQLYAPSQEDTTDAFDIIPSHYNPSNGTLEFDLSFDYFTNTRTKDGNYEAIIKIGNSSLGPNLNSEKITLSNDCSGIYIGCPAPSVACSVSSKYSNSRTVLGETRPHKGIDFPLTVGSNVLAAADGIVAFAGTNDGFGNCIIIQHNKYLTLYAHLSQIYVKKDQSVAEGSLIGLSGNTGRSTGPHLHFEYVIGKWIGKNSDRTDPEPLIDRSAVRLISANASCSAINDCSGGNGSSWIVNFNYKDLNNSITPNATLTFEDIEPVNNSPYTVSVGSLITATGSVASPVFCAHFENAEYIRVKVYLTLENGTRSNCIYFVLQRPAGANRDINTVTGEHPRSSFL